MLLFISVLYVVLSKGRVMMDCKVFAENVEPRAKKQIKDICESDAFAGSRIRIMPDVHEGAGCVIGFTGQVGNKIIPSVVGCDIGCGVAAVQLTKCPDFKRLDAYINKHVPNGMLKFEEIMEYAPLGELYCYDQMRGVKAFYQSLGTLGGGNHFIEVDYSEHTGCYYLTVHTGSRILGKRVEAFYTELALNHCAEKAVPKVDVHGIVEDFEKLGRKSELQVELSKIYKKRTKLCEAKKKLMTLPYLEGDLVKKYLHDMQICQDYAKTNRSCILRSIAEFLGEDFDSLELIDVAHNYIDKGGMVRKGAIAARMGEVVLIPLNMQDGLIVGRGLGNEDWNCSAPHGAGRALSRRKAKEVLRVKDFKNEMKDVYTTSVCQFTIDEAPGAYKPSENVLKFIDQTVDVVEILKPIYNFKCHKLQKPWESPQIFHR